MEERWTSINDIGDYEVSDEGRVRNRKTGKILSHNVDDQYDDIVFLYEGSTKHKRKVKRLVAEAYLDGDINHSYIQYKDGDKRNNKADNLYLKPKRLGKRIRVLETGEVYDSIAECSREMGVSKSTISKCLNYDFYNNVQGYHFELVNN